MLALFLHTFAHLGNQWHASAGPYGWWVWTEPARALMDGYGIVRDHFTSAFERR